MEAIILTIAFTAMILIPLVKNPVWWIHDYPKDIQEEYFKTHDRVPAEFFSPTVLLKKGLALLVALALLLGVVKLAGAAVMEKYLPKQLSEAEVEAKIKDIIAQVGATSIKDMGKVMGTANKALAGLSDGRTISTIVKKLLG